MLPLSRVLSSVNPVGAGTLYTVVCGLQCGGGGVSILPPFGSGSLVTCHFKVGHSNETTWQGVIFIFPKFELSN